MRRGHVLSSLSGALVVAACSSGDLDSLAGTGVGGSGGGAGSFGAKAGNAGASGRSGGGGASGSGGAAGKAGGAGMAGRSGSGAGGEAGPAMGGAAGVSGASGKDGTGVGGGAAPAGAAGKTGTAGSAGGGAVCKTKADCAAGASVCATADCAGGVCVLSFVGPGIAAPLQPVGDCRKDICDGAGNKQSDPDDSDVPAAVSSCASATCDKGVVVKKNAAEGAPCEGGACKAGACIALCGNGTLDPGEECDPAIAPVACAKYGRGSIGKATCSVSCTLDFAACVAPLVTFGGSADGTAAPGAINGETWEHVGGSWKNFNVPGPEPRVGAGLGSLGDGTVVLFGGITGSNRRNDTWVWNGSMWDQREADQKPSDRYSPATGSLDGKVVLFGGSGPEGDLDDTWEWDGSIWMQHKGNPHPSGVGGLAFANVGGDRLVLLGAKGETWQWKDAQWTKLSPKTSPAERGSSRGAAFGAGMLLFGGAGESGNAASYLGDTWHFRNGEWSKLLDSSPQLGPRRGFAMGSLGNQVVLFGGFYPMGEGAVVYDETRIFDGSQWTAPALTGDHPGKRMGIAFASR